MIDAKPLLLAMLLAGCATGSGTGPGAGATAEARDAGGRPAARATASAMGDGVHVRIEASGLAPGRYGAHVHMVGRCDPPGFDSAGGHWNPTSRQHGTLNPQGHHLGDLPNLEVAADGSGRIDLHIAGAMLRGGDGAMLDSDGAAVVIHAQPDDYRTDPSGNSGARIACGVLR